MKTSCGWAHTEVMSTHQIARRLIAPLVIALLLGLIAPTSATGVAAQRCLGRVATTFAKPGVVTRGTAGPDVIIGTNGPDIIKGLGGNDIICGRGGADRLVGGSGNDILVGGKGRDKIKGGRGADDLRGGPGNDFCSGGRGRDTYSRCERGVSAAPAELVSTSAGFDWTLPAAAEVGGGRLTGTDIDDDPEFVTGYFLSFGLRWKDLNPAPGDFDFSIVQDTLDQIGDRDLTVRLEVVGWCDVPNWAKPSLNHLSAGTVVFWDDAYLEALSPLINAFAQQFAANDRVVGVYLPIADGEFDPDGDCGGSRDGWGEMWMESDVLAEAQSDFGFTPAGFEDSVKDIVDSWVGAFSPHQSKLAYMNLDQLFVGEGDDHELYNAKMKLLGEYALAAGTGARDGQVESWLRYIDEPYGVGLQDTGDGSCRLTFDEQYAALMDGRYSSSENEFYGDHPWVLEAVGPIENQPYRFLVSSLRALQMRRNDLQIAEGEIASDSYRTQSMYPWLARVLGRNQGDTPDAFALLGERFARTSQVGPSYSNLCSVGGVTTVRNIERWLTEIGESEPTRRVDFPADEQWWGQDFYLDIDDHPFEYSARTSAEFAFDLDDVVALRRCGQNCDATLKVSYDATNAGASKLRVVSSLGRSARVKVRAGSGVKTASFELKGVAFENSLKGAADLLVRADEDLPILMVRLVFN